MTPMDAPQLRALAEAAGHLPGCDLCGPLDCPGWESLPPGFDARAVLHTVGTLRSDEFEPRWDEHHPHGTRLESPDAPIAVGFHPYNRSDVAVCTGCGKPFLRWTETGGYYVDERVRELKAALVVG